MRSMTLAFRRGRDSSLPFLAMAVAALSIGEARAQEPAAGSVLSLEQAIQEALAGNADLRIAASRRRMAEATADGGSSVYWPRLDFESGFVRSNDPVFAFGTKLRQGSFSGADFEVNTLNSPDPINDWVNRVSLQWKVFSPSDWTSRGAAARQADGARWNETRTREATILQTEILYLDAQRAAAHLAAARRAEEAAILNRDVFARRVEEGVLTRADLLQAEADRSHALARRVEAERRDEDSRRRLAVFLARDGGALPVLADSLRIEIPDPTVQLEAPAFDPSTRADIRALSFFRDAAEADSKRAGRAFLPEIGVFANYGIHASDAFRKDGDNWTVGVGLKWNIFSGFARSADRQRAGAAQAEADTRYATALREARAELDEATAGVISARRSVEATVAAEHAAAAGTDLMRRRFEEGLATASDLLQAESRRAMVESQAIDAQAGLRMSEARLRFVTTLHTDGIEK